MLVEIGGDGREEEVDERVADVRVGRELRGDHLPGVLQVGDERGDDAPVQAVLGAAGEEVQERVHHQRRDERVGREQEREVGLLLLLQKGDGAGAREEPAREDRPS